MRWMRWNGWIGSLRAAALVVGMVVLAGACGGPPLSPSQRAWVEQANLEVARINDTVAIHLLEAMVGVRPTPAGSTTATGSTATTRTGPHTTSGPNWPAVAAACTTLDRNLAEGRPVVASAPARFHRAATDLGTYLDQLASFSAPATWPPSTVTTPPSAPAPSRSAPPARPSTGWTGSSPTASGVRRW